MAFPHRASSSAASPGRVLAVDYGRRRIGLAISDELRLAAGPLETLERTNRRKDMQRLCEIVRTHGVTHILVGQPLHLDGRPSEMAEEAARFARRLEKELGVPVELVDERLTSWEAGELARAGASSNRSHDELAAALLLREWLTRHGTAASPAVPVQRTGEER